MREIKCGEIFCEYCGDCYYCYGDDVCYASGTEGDHFFILEEETEGTQND